MRQILEVIQGRYTEDEARAEAILNEAERGALYAKAEDILPGGWDKLIVWHEFDTMSEAPANNGCCYHLVEKSGKRTLRVCSLSQERR